MPLSSRLIHELHQKLMQSGCGTGKSPGEFRRVQDSVGGVTPSAAEPVPPPPQFVEPCIADLERFLNDVPGRHPPLIKAALAPVQFETIHPFPNGNGRVGRLLIPLLLVQEKVLQQPLLYPSLYFKLHRARYDELLSHVRRSGDRESWLGFFADAVRLCAAQAVRNINSICAETAQSPVTVAAALVRLAERLALVRELTGKRRNRVFGCVAYLDTLNREAWFGANAAAPA